MFAFSLRRRRRIRWKQSEGGRASLVSNAPRITVAVLPLLSLPFFSQIKTFYLTLSLESVEKRVFQPFGSHIGASILEFRVCNWLGAPGELHIDHRMGGAPTHNIPIIAVAIRHSVVAQTRCEQRDQNFVVLADEGENPGPRQQKQNDG